MDAYTLILDEIANSSVKVLAIIVSLIYLSYIRSRKNHESLNYLHWVLVFLLLRDFIFSIIIVTLKVIKINALDYGLNPSYFLVVTDVILYCIYFAWIKSFTTRNDFSWVTVTNIVIFAVTLVNFFLVRALIDLMTIIHGGWLLFNALFFARALLDVSKYNTDDAEVIISSRQILITGFLCQAVLTLLPYPQINNRIIQSIFMVLIYGIHPYVLYRYHFIIDRDLQNSKEFIENDLESLFEYMRVLGRAIAEKLSLDEILGYLITSTVKTTSADAGAILMVDEYDDILKVKAVSGFFPPLYPVPPKVKSKISSIEAYFKSTPIRLGETILGEAAQKGESVFIRNTFDDNRLRHNAQNDTLFVSSVIIVPLVINKRVLGVLAILNRDRNKLFTDNDFMHLKTFAEYSTLTIDFVLTYIELLEKREMEREIGIAADIQKKLLPKKIPRIKNADLQAYSLPAKGVSGDYWDVLQLKGEKVALVICDVAGKGVPAALVMVMIRSILHLIASSDREISTILTWVNRGISGQIDIDHYATMSMLAYDPTTGEVTYSNAAHHPLLIYRAKTQQLETLDTEGLPIGIEKSTRYGQKRIKIRRGDILAMYTDGIIEAMNASGEQYSSERFAKLLTRNSSLSTKEIVEALKQDLNKFVGSAKQHDDQTLLLMKVN
ncbi:MAG: SpoIIE family protein phosphatase [Spirochaetales bacterium]|nr:SpoIIE family protein phosphatase [Spirochaetales bacterium]